MESKIKVEDRFLDGYGTLNEKKIYGLLRKEKPNVYAKIEKIVNEINYDANLAMSFVLALLEEVNVGHKTMKKLNKIFQKVSEKTE